MANVGLFSNWMKKSKLDTSFEVDFDLFGLVCPAKEYKLAWHLNQSLEFSLSKKEDIKIEFSNQTSILISCCSYETENQLIELLQNKLLSSGGTNTKYLLPELNQFDYLLKIRDHSNELTSENVTDNIKRIPIVEYVMRLNFDGLKSKENLLY